MPRVDFFPDLDWDALSQGFNDIDNAMRGMDDAKTEQLQQMEYNKQDQQSQDGLGSTENYVNLLQEVTNTRDTAEKKKSRIEQAKQEYGQYACFSFAEKNLDTLMRVAETLLTKNQYKEADSLASIVKTASILK